MRFLRFRLRSIFMLVAIIAVPLAFIGNYKMADKRRATIIKELSKIGFYVSTTTNQHYVKILHISSYYYVEYFGLNRSDRVTDQKLELAAEKLADFDKPVGIDLMMCEGITGAGLAHLKSIPHLVTLNLDETGVTNDDMKYIEQMKELKMLILTHISLGKDGIAYLSQLPKLEELFLSHIQVSNEMLAILGNMKKLKVLGLDRIKAQGGGLNSLA